MSTIVMTERIARSSPKFKARIAGGFSLLTLVLAVFAQGLYEPFAASVVPFIVGLGIVAALANIVWLLVFGVNEQRWKEQASAAAASIWK